MSSLSAAVWVQRALSAAVELGVPDLLAAGPRPLTELAALTASEPSALRRVLRLLAAEGWLSPSRLPDGDDAFALAPLGAGLRSDAPLSARWLLLDDATWAAAGAVVHSVRTGRPAFDHVHGTSFWQHLGDDRAAAERFHAKMRTQALLLCLPALLGLPWDDVRTVADVGGGSGVLLGHLLREHDHLRGLVLDRPHAETDARETLRELGVADRAAFASLDLLTESPPVADAVVLSRVLHDWDDDDATALLRRLRPALLDGGRLLVLEMLAPEDAVPHPSAVTDVNLMVLFGGAHERTSEQLAELLRGAGLVVRRQLSTATPVVVTEAVAARP